MIVDVECTHEGSLKHIAKFVEYEENDGNCGKMEDYVEDGDGKGKKSNGCEGGVYGKEAVLSNKERKRRAKQAAQNEERRLKKSEYFSSATKSNEWSLDDFKERVLDPKKLQSLHQLQCSLLEAGLQICQPGGLVIYSTCSLSSDQNEKVVTDVFNKLGSNKFELINVFSHVENPDKYGIKQSTLLPGTYRLHAEKYNVGFMYVAKIRVLNIT